MAQPVTSLSLEYAIQLWTRRHSGTWSDDDEAELRRWIDASAEHRDAYAKVAALWTTAGGLEGRIQRPPIPVRSARTQRLLAMCAAVLIVAIALPLWQLSYNWWNGIPVRWVADRGAPRTVTLPDGTRIELDAGSELLVKLGARVRRASLVRGEALFTVVHDSLKPFELQAGTGRITDLGTRFDVETLGGQVRISVFEGRIGIATPHGEMQLGAGRGGGYDVSGVLLPITQTDTAAVLWQDGKRRFEGMPLSEVVERLTRYHPVTFAFSDPQVQKLRLSGTFRVTDLPLFLRTLSAALPVDVHWVDSQHVELTARAAGSARSPQSVEPQQP